MADFRWGDEFAVDDDEDLGDEAGGHKWQFGNKDGLIFLIDCTSSMFEKEGGEELSPFELCIKSAKTVIQNKIISSNKDLIGVVFFGTKEAKNSSDFKNVFVLHDLDLPGAERVLQLEALLNEPNNDDFDDNFGHSDTYSLSDALWACSDLFSNCTQKLGFKRVMLFTNNDDPHRNSQQLKRQAMAKVEDLHQNSIAIELMHINKPGERFDVSLFYKDILYTDEEDDEAALPDPAEKFDELLTRVRSKDHKKRALTRITVNMGNTLNFSVGVYNLVRSCYKPSAVKLYKRTNEEVKSVSKTFIEETGELLLPQDVKKAQIYAGKKICFETEEVTDIKKFGDPGLKLLGFKPTKKIKRYYHVKPGQFIYPDESTYEGSTCLFSAMLQKCLERDVVAICRYIPRKNTPPRFVALIPQEEEVDEHNIQLQPPGFHLMFLPFADDFRKIKLEEERPRANVDQIEAAKALVKKLQYKFDPSDFENPALQTHYVNIEAMALDRDEPDEVHDCTEPNEAAMDKKAGRLMEEFKDLVFPDGYVPGARKRAAPSGGGGSKRAKVDAAEVNVEAEARAGRINKLTVAILKDYIKTNNIRTTATKKADLITAITTHLGL